MEEFTGRHLTLDAGPDFRLDAGSERCPMATVGIGKLAKQAGVPIDTVRHYERIGLQQDRQ